MFCWSNTHNEVYLASTGFTLFRWNSETCLTKSSAINELANVMPCPQVLPAAHTLLHRTTITTYTNCNTFFWNRGLVRRVIFPDKKMRSWLIFWVSALSRQQTLISTQRQATKHSVDVSLYSSNSICSTLSYKYVLIKHYGNGIGRTVAN